MNLRNLEEEFPHDWEDDSLEKNSLNFRTPYYKSKDQKENPPRSVEINQRSRESYSFPKHTERHYK